MSIIKADFRLKRYDFSLNINCEIDTPITGIFGPSGAGKTSFLHVLAGLTKPDEGVLLINDKEVYNSDKKINLPPEKRKIGYVFQEGRLFPHMTVLQNLKYGIKKEVGIININEVSDLLNITANLQQKTTQISGGQAQRVAIGRALLSSPDILVLDEPFSSLDKHLRQNIIYLLKPLINKLQIPLLVISHDLSDLLLLSDQLLIINNGNCTSQGSYFDLISQENAVHQLSRSGLVNSIELKIDHVNSKKGVMILSKERIKIYAESGWHGEQYSNERTLIVFLRPEDITLALHEIKDISIQNQIEGTIIKLVETENKMLCIIDHGFRLIAEVTLATKEKMNLKEGQIIWSLFKAAAVKMNSPGIKNSLEI